MTQLSSNRRRCAQCGTELALDAAGELCPKCLLQGGLPTLPDLGPTGTVVLPSPARAQGYLPSGDRLGHYAILRLLGEGGMGAVYEAEDIENGRRIALKVLGHALHSPEARARFFREGRLAASINHPNSVYVFGTEEVGGTPVIAMELVDGGTLQQRIDAQGPLPVKEAIDCILQIIDGLEAAQRIGILHRDVKPSNCFQASDGVIKIGDFGLSISTAIRTEPALTVTGAFLGTPAFSSPEQLRGDELNARSDIYSVGATLFYLLTGRTPFEAKNVVQLLATVLEKRAPSPRAYRPEIPRGLTGAISRCLEKQPGERFRTYDELRRVLVPYGTTAPSPATLGLRFLAGTLDLLILSLFNVAVLFAIGFRNPFEFIGLMTQGSSKVTLLWILLGLGDGVVYFTFLEGIRGASLGKALCRLRVITQDNNSPGLLRALVRALIYILVPPMPYWLVFGFDPRNILTGSVWLQSGMGLTFYMVLALLFCTVRRRNGFAALHDLMTRTRVVSSMAVPARATLAEPDSSPALNENTPVLGPYHILETLEDAANHKWLAGFDMRLLRKVWIHSLPPNTPEIAPALRALARPGRLRWLTGRRTPNENWDAFEFLSGQPLLKLLGETRPWAQVRFWLYDLANEIRAAEKEGTVPTLSLDRVWITAEGQAKLLDFPAPGVQTDSGIRSDKFSAGSEAAEQRSNHDLDPKAFLIELARRTLQGPVHAQTAPLESEPAVPLPAHARAFLRTLAKVPSTDAILFALKPLLNRPTVVSRARRAFVVLGCAAIPLMVAFSSLFGMRLMQQWDRTNPGLLDLNQILQARTTLNRWAKNQPHPTDQQFSIYIATHYANFITNQASWTSPLTLTMLKDADRKFAEKSVADAGSFSDEDIAGAENALKPYRPRTDIFSFQRMPWILHFVPAVALVLYVGLPALVAALLFRGGLVMFLAGISLVRSDGSRASRGLVFWRAVLAWSSLLLGSGLFLLLRWFGMSTTSAATAAWGLVAFLVLISLYLPERGLPDRLAGTWPIVR